MKVIRRNEGNGRNEGMWEKWEGMEEMGWNGE